jgi:hypothetical protein
MTRHSASMMMILSLACSSPSLSYTTATVNASARVAPRMPAASAKPLESAPPAADTTVPKTLTREEQLIARMLERVSRARGLVAKRSVPGVMLDRSALMGRVKSHVDREVPHDAIVEEGLVQQLLGFIPTRFDYEGATYALLQAQLAGFYEPADGTMYMAADLDDDSAFATLAHELVHALQDQYWDLGKRSKYVSGQDDGSSAFSALAEGDATSAMADVLIGQAKAGATALDMPDELFAQQIIGGMSGGPTSSAPHVMRMALAAPYIDGTLFVHALRRKGGWHAVNHAWDDPPETTEQLLHLDKWEARERALAIPDPTFAALGPGWSVAEADTYGELGLRLSLGEWLGETTAALLASGWGGDRGVLMKKGDAYAFAWHVRYDDAKPKASDAYAARAFSGLVPAIEKLGPGRAKGPSAFVCVDRHELGPLAVLHRSRDLVFLAGPAKVAPKAWSALSKCDLAQRWATEIASDTTRTRTE